MLRLLMRLGLISCFWMAPGTLIGSSEAQEVAGWREVRYRENQTVFANPERGFYAPRMSHRMNGLDSLRARGITLVLVEMDLREFKDREISPEKLDELRRAFASARENGLKVIFRAAYGFTGRDYRADPKDLGRILGHIGQLEAIFEADRDMLLSVQAGFLGPWGGMARVQSRRPAVAGGASRRAIRPAQGRARPDPGASPPAYVRP